MRLPASWLAAIGVGTTLALASPCWAHQQISLKLEQLNVEITEHPNDADLYVQRGELYRQNREWALAETDFRKAVDLTPDNPDLDFHLGRLWFEAGRPESALWLRDAPPAGPALRSFRRWLDRTPTAPFVAHNAAFDAGFVERALRESGLDAYRGPLLCTRRLGRRLLPELGRYDLDHLCAHFGISNPARHRALGDVEATARAWTKLLELAVSREGATRVGDLLDLQARPTRRRRAS